MRDVYRGLQKLPVILRPAILPWFLGVGRFSYVHAGRGWYVLRV